MSFTVSAFYKFVPISDCHALRDELFALGHSEGLCGTILLAPEGINATVAGPDPSVRVLLCHLKSDPRFADLVSKESLAQARPFDRWKVKLKDEILTFGAPEANPSLRVGTYVAPKDWNALISQDDVVLIDTRNGYECAVGTFRRAIDPGTRSFTGFKDFVSEHLDSARDTKIAMFCTGGIRCEKASAFLLAHGFSEVYHLQGGILKYLDEVPEEESLWQGACFVFDERVAVTHGVRPGGHSLCARCGHPVAPGEDRCSACYTAAPPATAVRPFHRPSGS